MANGLLLGGIIKKAIYWFFLTIDGLALDIARAAYKVFYFTSKITLLSGDQIERFTNRVYLILGLALVFIIAYNLLTYIIDPDKISDKKAGAAAFIKNVIISLVIVVITPMAFVKLYSFQNIIIEQGVIGNIILGTSAPNEGPEECWHEEGVELSTKEQRACSEALLEQGANNAVASVFMAFVIPTSGQYLASDCGKADYNPDGDMGKYCAAYYVLLNYGSITNAEDENGNEIVGMKELILDEVNEDNPKYKYYLIFCTAGILATGFFFLSYCLELGKRAGKLAILQLLAPIPVLMEIVPGKSGSRQKWLNMTISTYLDVFIYQATIFIVIFLITFVPGAIDRLFNTTIPGVVDIVANPNPDPDLFGSLLLRSASLIFVIFGLLKFGKEVPKMIEDLLGIKGAGSFGDVAKRAFAMAGVSGAAIKGSYDNIKSGWTDNKGLSHKIGGALLGGASAFGRNIWAGRNVHNFKDAKNSRKKVNEAIIKRRVNRQVAAFDHDNSYVKLYGHKFAIDPVKKTIQGFKNIPENAKNTAYRFIGSEEAVNSYAWKERTENVHKKIKEYGDAITDIFNNDAQMQTYRNAYLQASNSTDQAALKAKMQARMADIAQKQKNKFRIPLSDLNTYIASHQSYEGVVDKKIDIDAFANSLHPEDFFKINDATGKVGASNIAIGSGYSLEDTINGTEINSRSYADEKKIRADIIDNRDTPLKAFGKDIKYQDQKTEIEIKERAKKQAEEAAKEKSAEKK